MNDFWINNEDMASVSDQGVRFSSVPAAGQPLISGCSLSGQKGLFSKQKQRLIQGPGMCLEDGHNQLPKKGQWLDTPI